MFVLVATPTRELRLIVIFQVQIHSKWLSNYEPLLLGGTIQVRLCLHVEQKVSGVRSNTSLFNKNIFVFRD